MHTENAMPTNGSPVRTWERRQSSWIGAEEAVLTNSASLFEQMVRTGPHQRKTNMLKERHASVYEEN